MTRGRTEGTSTDECWVVGLDARLWRGNKRVSELKGRKLHGRGENGERSGVVSKLDEMSL